MGGCWAVRAVSGNTAMPATKASIFYSSHNRLSFSFFFLSFFPDMGLVVIPSVVRGAFVGRGDKLGLGL